MFASLGWQPAFAKSQICWFQGRANLFVPQHLRSDLQVEFFTIPGDMCGEHCIVRESAENSLWPGGLVNPVMESWFASITDCCLICQHLTLCSTDEGHNDVVAEALIESHQLW